MLVDESNDSTLTKVEENDAFIDAWTMIHQDEGFTFPTCKPIKRIDFVLVRNNSDCVQQCFPSSIVDTFIVGRNPTEDTGKKFYHLHCRCYKIFVCSSFN
jgi:hypothetical protein